MSRLLVLTLLVALALPAGADEVRKEEPLLCTLGQIRICTADDDCAEKTADELGVPRFVVVDPGAGKFRDPLANRESKFTKVANQDGLLVLQGFENMRAWSAVISDSRDLTLVATSAGIAFSVFGSCVPVSAVEEGGRE